MKSFFKEVAIIAVGVAAASLVVVPVAAMVYSKLTGNAAPAGA